MSLVLLGLLASLTAGDLTDDWNEIQSLIQEMLTDMQGIDTQWTGVAENITGSISQMASRIVYTEGLIDDMGDQIGVMSGRIVATEYLMSNLTAKCLHCQVTLNYEVPEIKKTSLPVRSLQSRSEGLRAEGSSFDSLVDFMNYTVSQMVTASTMMSGLFDDIDSQVGAMADRIVVTECLIMNMSLQIGDMADRIVATENLMKNATEVCCDAEEVDLTAEKVKQHYPVDCYGLRSTEYEPLRYVNPLTAHLERIQSRLVNAVLPPFNPLDPIDWMLASMEVSEEVMMEMFNASMTVADECVSEIGSLADQIVSMEDNIMTTAGYIGDVSDCIVEVEAMMTAWAQDMCKGLSPRKTQSLQCAQIQRIQYYSAEARTMAPIREPVFQVPEPPAAGGQYENVIVDIYDDMVDFSNLMASMLANMVKVFNSMLGTMNQLGDDIQDTAQLILEMEQEIQTMVGKIMQTISLMNSLQQDCFDHLASS